MVCIAVFHASAASTLSGKMLGLWMPVALFVAVGLEHSGALCVSRASCMCVSHHDSCGMCVSHACPDVLSSQPYYHSRWNGLPWLLIIPFHAFPSVANMFIIPLGIALGAKVSISNFLLNNLLPVTVRIKWLNGSYCHTCSSLVRCMQLTSDATLSLYPYSL